MCLFLLDYPRDISTLELLVTRMLFGWRCTELNPQMVSKFSRKTWHGTWVRLINTVGIIWKGRKACGICLTSRQQSQPLSLTSTVSVYLFSLPLFHPTNTPTVSIIGSKYLAVTDNMRPRLLRAKQFVINGWTEKDKPKVQLSTWPSPNLHSRRTTKFGTFSCLKTWWLWPFSPSADFVMLPTWSFCLHL